MQKVLVTGANGQLGHKINQLLSENFDLTLTDADTMDITDKEEVLETVKSIKPDFIIHGAAYTKVDAAEENEALCRKINATGTENVAKAASEVDATLIYISTDFVFDGKRNSPYSEDDKTNPLSVYGLTKREGEEAIQKFCPKHYIIRVAWLFGELPENYPGSNFVETMLRLAKEKGSLSVVNDQIGSPTYTKDLVETIKLAIDSAMPYGTYHFSGTGECSWYDFAQEIFDRSKTNIKLSPIDSDHFTQKAKRPPYSYMDKAKIEKTLGIKVRTWQEMLGEYLKAR